MAKTARHSPIQAAAAATSKARTKRKGSSKSASGGARTPKSGLAKAAAAVGDAGSTAVEAVKDIVHKGEEMVAKVFGSKSAKGAGKGGSKKKSGGKKG